MSQTNNATGIIFDLYDDDEETGLRGSRVTKDIGTPLISLRLCASQQNLQHWRFQQTVYTEDTRNSKLNESICNYLTSNSTLAILPDMKVCLTLV